MITAKDFERIALKNERRLYAHALMILRSHADAEDAAEDAIYKLFRGKRIFDSEEHCAAWLVRVTVNNACKMLEKRKRFADDDSALENISERFEYPEQLEIYEALSNLDEKYRTIVMLFYYEDMTVKQIADALSMSSGAVRTRLSRAREQLKSILGE